MLKFIQFCIIVLVAFGIALSQDYYNKPSGDVNCDGVVDVADITSLIGYVFNKQPLPQCYPTTDTLIDTVLTSGRLTIKEIISKDTTIVKHSGYYTNNYTAYVHRLLVYRNGILCDSVKFYDFLHRVNMYSTIRDTFPQGCGGE